MIQLEKEKPQDPFIRVKSDKESAFEELFYLYQPSVFRFLYRYTDETQATDDVLHDIFIKYGEIKEKLDLSFSPNALLHKIALNLAMNFITCEPPFQPLYGKNDVLIKKSRKEI